MQKAGGRRWSPLGKSINKKIKNEIFKFLYKKIGFKNSGFLMEFWTLDGLERSGRPVGIISTYFRQKRSGGFRVMTKKPIIFTTIKFTSIKV